MLAGRRTGNRGDGVPAWNSLPPWPRKLTKRSSGPGIHPGKRFPAHPCATLDNCRGWSPASVSPAPGTADVDASAAIDPSGATPRGGGDVHNPAPVRREAGVRDRLARLDQGFGVFLDAIQQHREHRRIQGAPTEQQRLAVRRESSRRPIPAGVANSRFPPSPVTGRSTTRCPSPPRELHRGT